MAASLKFEGDPYTDQLLLFEDQEEIDTELLMDDTSEVLEISALNWVEFAERMSEDRSRGSYDKITKATGFFLCHSKHQKGCSIIRSTWSGRVLIRKFIDLRSLRDLS
jgi:hypothetical protein